MSGRNVRGSTFSAERAKNTAKRKKRIHTFKIAIATTVAAAFAILFLLPIVLTITNSFMSSSEISANYGSVFATNEKGGKVYKVHGVGITLDDFKDIKVVGIKSILEVIQPGESF